MANVASACSAAAAECVAFKQGAAEDVAGGKRASSESLSVQSILGTDLERLPSLQVCLQCSRSDLRLPVGKTGQRRRREGARFAAPALQRGGFTPFELQDDLRVGRGRKGERSKPLGGEEALAKKEDSNSRDAKIEADEQASLAAVSALEAAFSSAVQP